MNNNMISLYQDPILETQDTFRKLRRRSCRQQICFWISYIVDTIATIAITSCTVFCCYLALTML